MRGEHVKHMCHKLRDCFILSNCVIRNFMHFRIDLELAFATFPALFSVLLDSLVLILLFNLIYFGISFSTLLYALSLSVSLSLISHTLLKLLRSTAKHSSIHQFISNSVIVLDMKTHSLTLEFNRNKTSEVHRR